MSREQYEQSSRQNDDLFAEYLEDLPDPDVKISPQVEQDIRQIEQEVRGRKSTRRRLAACLAGGLMAAVLAPLIIRFSQPQVPEPEPSPPIVIQMPGYDLMILDMLRNTDRDLSSTAQPGTDLKDDSITIHGKTVHLPTSLHVFLQNGWSVDSSLFLDVSDGFTTVRYDLVYLDRSTHLTVFVMQPAGRDVPVYSIVTEVHDGGSGQIELPGGIRRGSSEAELIDALNHSGVSWHTDTADDTGITTYAYSISLDNSFFKNSHIEVRVENSMVIDISVSVSE